MQNEISLLGYGGVTDKNVDYRVKDNHSPLKGLSNISLGILEKLLLVQVKWEYTN